MDPTSRPGIRQGPADVSVHRAADHGARAGGAGRQRATRRRRRRAGALGDRRIAERSALMDILRRSSAQLSEAVWKELDEAAATAARNVMTARRIATFD